MTLCRQLGAAVVVATAFGPVWASDSPQYRVEFTLTHQVTSCIGASACRNEVPSLPALLITLDAADVAADGEINLTGKFELEGASVSPVSGLWWAREGTIAGGRLADVRFDAGYDHLGVYGYSFGAARGQWSDMAYKDYEIDGRWSYERGGSYAIQSMPVPEPPSALLWTIALASLGSWARRRGAR